MYDVKYKPGVLAAALVALVCASASAQESTPREQFQMKGERVCVKRRPGPDGRVQMDCTIGLRGDDDRFYGLRALDLSRIVPFPTMNTRVVVTGTFIPGTSGSFETVGDIVWTSIEPIADPKPVVGKLLCVKDEGPQAASGTGCRHIVQTAGGLLWGLEPQSLAKLTRSQPLTPGALIEVEGEILSGITESWGPRPIEGVLVVKSGVFPKTS